MELFHKLKTIGDQGGEVGLKVLEPRFGSLFGTASDQKINGHDGAQGGFGTPRLKTNGDMKQSLTNTFVGLGRVHQNRLTLVHNASLFYFGLNEARLFVLGQQATEITGAQFGHPGELGLQPNALRVQQEDTRGPCAPGGEERLRKERWTMS